MKFFKKCVVLMMSLLLAIGCVAPAMAENADHTETIYATPNIDYTISKEETGTETRMGNHTDIFDNISLYSIDGQRVYQVFPEGNEKIRDFEYDPDALAKEQRDAISIVTASGARMAENANNTATEHGCSLATQVLVYEIAMSYREPEHLGILDDALSTEVLEYFKNPIEKHVYAESYNNLIRIFGWYHLLDEVGHENWDFCVRNDKENGIITFTCSNIIFNTYGQSLPALPSMFDMGQTEMSYNDGTMTMTTTKEFAERVFGSVGKSKEYYIPKEHIPKTNIVSETKNMYVAIDLKQSCFTKISLKVALNFADVDENSWYYDAVEYAYNHEIMVGTENGFEPKANMSRAMLMTILYRLEDATAGERENPFTDVKTDQWYTDAVLWAYESGLAEGYGNGRFGPGDPVTREQLATIIMRYAQHRGTFEEHSEDMAVYADNAKISKWARPAMEWAYAEGIMVGFKSGGLNYIAPRRNTTRAEAAMIFMGLAS